MTAFDFGKIVTRYGLIRPEFLRANGYKSYLLYDVFVTEELERLARCAGLTDGSLILFTLKEGSEPQETIAASSISEAEDVVFGNSYKKYLIEFIPNYLYVWHEPDNDFFIAFGTEHVLNKCIDLEAFKRAYYFMKKDQQEPGEYASILKQMDEDYNTLDIVKKEIREK